MTRVAGRLPPRARRPSRPPHPETSPGSSRPRRHRAPRPARRSPARAAAPSTGPARTAPAQPGAGQDSVSNVASLLLLRRSDNSNVALPDVVPTASGRATLLLPRGLNSNVALPDAVTGQAGRSGPAHRRAPRAAAPESGHDPSARPAAEAERPGAGGGGGAARRGRRRRSGPARAAEAERPGAGGGGYLRRRDIRRSARGLPPVWQVAQYWRAESAKDTSRTTSPQTGQVSPARP